MARDWLEWYRQYDDPGSSLNRRLVEVRRQIGALLEPRPAQVVSMCAGDGRDLLPMLAEGAPETPALLVELDPELSARARATALEAGLDQVSVSTGDAGLTDSYATHVPADLLLACGVFGNITDEDLVRTVDLLPTLLAPGGQVLWTRGSRVPQDPTGVTGDPADHVRALFADAGFEEVTFVRPDDASYRVGVHRLVVAPTPFEPGGRMFDFV